MNTTIQITLTPEDLKGIVKDAVRDEMSELKQEIESLVNGRLVSPQEAMRLLNVKSYATVKGMWEREEIVMTKIAGKPRITRKSINKYIENGSI
jgi:hypothetical protein